MSRADLIAEARRLFPVPDPDATHCCPFCGVYSHPSFTLAQAHMDTCPKYRD